MFKMKRLIFLPMLLIFMAGSVCFGGSELWPTNGWKTSTPEEQGMDSAKLAGMMHLINQQAAPVHGIVVVRYGQLVMEAYGYPYDQNKPHLIYSCTKVFTSALLGIAMKEGYIADTDRKLSDLFPGSVFGQGMGDISLKHLLTMSSGMDIPEYASQMERSDNWVNFVLGKPVVRTPGSEFSYNDAGAHLVLAAIAKATGKTPAQYAQEKIFGPLGIKDYKWDTDPQGIHMGGDGLYLQPRDMAKMGYLYLKNGVWDGKEVVPAKWVEVSTRKQIETPGEMLGQNGYGYFWWMEEFGGYSALGYAGQYIFVVPEKDLVVVFTADMANDFQFPRRMMKLFILPSIKSDQALPANAKGMSTLNKAIQDLNG